MALALVGAGARVLILARSGIEIESTVAEAKACGDGLCHGTVADVSNFEACCRSIDVAEQTFGPVEVLVNNAGTALPIPMGTTAADAVRPFWSVDPFEVERIAQVNLLGPYRMSSVVIPGMMERGFGKIVNISTSLPNMRRPNNGPYGPLKAALEMSTHIWASELADTGVTANVLLPGGISDTALMGGENVGRRARPFAAGKGPLGQEGRSTEVLPPDIMGPPILWLASDESNRTTGRRFIARDWDPDLPPSEAAQRAMQPPAETPIIM